MPPLPLIQYFKQPTSLKNVIIGLFFRFFFYHPTPVMVTGVGYIMFNCLYLPKHPSISYWSPYHVIILSNLRRGIS